MFHRSLRSYGARAFSPHLIYKHLAAPRPVRRLVITASHLMSVGQW